MSKTEIAHFFLLLLNWLSGVQLVKKNAAIFFSANFVEECLFQNKMSTFALAVDLVKSRGKRTACTAVVLYSSN